MNIRYVISHMDKDGLRAMTDACQGRNTVASIEEARVDLHNFLTNNTPERLVEVFGTQSAGTFEVSAVDCWPGHNDPKGCYISEELNPGQVTMVKWLKDILDDIDRKDASVKQ